MSAEASVTDIRPRQLSKFENRRTTRVGVEIPGAAGGLRDPMRFEPVEHRQFERVFVLLECDVFKVRFDPVVDKDDDGVEIDRKENVRVEVLRTHMGTFMDPEVAKPLMDDQKRRVQEARDAEAGIMHLAIDGGDDEGDSED